MSPDEALKDPFVLEFLNLKDEYSELELEDALIKQLESFLLELMSVLVYAMAERFMKDRRAQLAAAAPTPPAPAPAAPEPEPPPTDYHRRWWYSP